MARMVEAPQSATERRKLRRLVRELVGTTRDEAPTARTAIRLVALTAKLVQLATNDRYGVALIDRELGTFVEPDKVLDADWAERGTA